jgi:tRNA threonylcarbamoyladenosine biosynthesis protein TsaE
MTPLSLPLADEAASAALGVALADLVVAGFAEAHDPSFDGFTIHFSGDLGAGKTTVVRALLRRLGVDGRIKSPTYTLVEPYVVEMPKRLESRQSVKLDCYHFDFYRFEDPHEWLDAGFRDYFADAALRLVEWPERAVGDGGVLLPAPDVHVMLAAAAGGRVATVAAGTARGGAWLTRAALAGVS